MKTLKRTINGENGELYYTKDGRRKILAECKPKIEFYEETKNVPMLGGTVCPVKTRYIRLIICGDMEYAREIDENFLRGISSFELSADFERSDGCFETIVFDGLTPVEIYLDGDWTFSFDNRETLRRLLTL